MGHILTPGFCSGCSGCDDCEGERGERGKRGKRGHRGHRGHDGQDGATGPMGPSGPTGPTGPTGSTGPTGEAANTGATGPSGPTGSTGPAGPAPLDDFAAARCDPNPPTDVPVTSQTGHFESPGTYVAVGVYTMRLNVIPGLTTANQVLWNGTAFSQGHIVTLQPGFSGGQATVGVRIVTDAGVPVDDSFYLHGKIVGL